MQIRIDQATNSNLSLVPNRFVVLQLVILVAATLDDHRCTYKRSRSNFSRILGPRIHLKVKVKEDCESQNLTIPDACSTSRNHSLNSSASYQEQEQEMAGEVVTAAVIANEGQERL